MKLNLMLVAFMATVALATAMPEKTHKQLQTKIAAKSVSYK